MPYLMPSTYRELGRTDGIFAGDLLEQLMCFTVDKQQTQLWVPTHLVAVLGTSGVEYDPILRDLCGGTALRFTVLLSSILARTLREMDRRYY